MPSEVGAGQAIRPRNSVRYRLLAIALLPMLVILPLFLGVAIYRWTTRFDAMLLSKADGDLTIARQYFRQRLENGEASLVSLGASARFRDMLANASRPGGDLDALLATELGRQRLDFLYLVGADGRVLAASGRGTRGPLRSDWPAQRAALGGRARTDIDLFSAAELTAISPDLAARARIDILSTARAKPTDHRVETRGLVIQSAAPVVMPDGRRAALVGILLLNRNLPFVDTINSLVYHDASLPEGSRGTTTLFLGDVRVSTSVRLDGGMRALGTRASAEVSDEVLEHGRNWLQSAFVVDDWYVSAYEPIEDSGGRRVGMLYVGFLEKPFTAMRREILIFISFAFLLVAGLTVPLFLRWARDIFMPLERMTATIEQVEEGNLAARTGQRDGTDEIGKVALHLDTLLDDVQQRDRALREWNDELNRRVHERTENLLLANKRLEETTRQLVMSEKLAAIGEITAGVAHEINNPLAVMQGNLEIIRGEIGAAAEPVAFEFRLLDEQIDRISRIVTKLLQFAKPSEYAGDGEPLDPADVVSDTLPLVEHILRQTTISVERVDTATRQLGINKTELQQILVNLIVNAIHAMPEGGRLLIATHDSDSEGGEPGVAIEVADTGTGMTPEIAARIFDPFFTTRERDGNGLGLSICQMIVSRERGSLSVSSTPGEGTRFRLWLPEGARTPGDAEGQTV